MRNEGLPGAVCSYGIWHSAMFLWCRENCKPSRWNTMCRWVDSLLQESKHGRLPALPPTRITAHHSIWLNLTPSVLYLTSKLYLYPLCSSTNLSIKLPYSIPILSVTFHMHRLLLELVLRMWLMRLVNLSINGFMSVLEVDTPKTCTSKFIYLWSLLFPLRVYCWVSILEKSAQRRSFISL